MCTEKAGSRITTARSLLLLVPVLAQSFLALVRRHFVLLSFFSAWHRCASVFFFAPPERLNKLF